MLKFTENFQGISSKFAARLFLDNSSIITTELSVYFELSVNFVEIRHEFLENNRELQKNELEESRLIC